MMLFGRKWESEIRINRKKSEKVTVEVLKSKIHRVAVTQADLNYIGSITIDEALMEAAGLLENERVYIYDINNGERFDTYVIKGARNSGVIGLNGAAARKVAVGDLVIIVAYAQMTPDEAAQFKPRIVFPKTTSWLKANYRF